MSPSFLSTVAATLAALDVEMTTAAHSAGDGLTLRRALDAAERHYCAARTAILDAHDLALGILPDIAPAPATSHQRAA